MRRRVMAILIGMVGLTGCSRDDANHVVASRPAVSNQLPAETPSMPAPLAPSAPASVVRAETEADQGFPYRAVDALRRQGAVSEAEFMTAHPTATCFSTLSDARVCEVQRPAHELCPGDITCTSVGYVFKGTKVVAARFTRGGVRGGLSRDNRAPGGSGNPLPLCTRRVHISADDHLRPARRAAAI